MIDEPIRLQKYLSQMGVSSRRNSEELILAGKILVNGKKAVLGQKVTIKDQISVEGKIVKAQQAQKQVYLLNKPIGVVSSTVNQDQSQTVIDLIGLKEKLYPIGRLDKNTSGLILLTNDGDIAYHLTHPKFKIEKEYLVRINKPLSDDQIKKLLNGIHYKKENYQADKIERISFCNYKITLHEGKNREIRKMIQYLKREVISLQRIKFAGLELGDLSVGQSRLLTPLECESLLN